MIDFDVTKPRGPRRRMRVDGGRTSCPFLGAVDFERCLECLYLVRFEDGRSLFVVCQGPLRGDAAVCPAAPSRPPP